MLKTRNSIGAAFSVVGLAAFFMAAACGGGDPENADSEIVSESRTPTLAVTSVTLPLNEATVGPGPTAPSLPTADATPVVGATPDPAGGPSATPEPLPTVTPTPPATPIPVHTLSQAEREAIATSFIEVTAAGDYTGAAAHFDETVAEALSPDELAVLWEGLTGWVGDYLVVTSFTESDQGFFKLLVAEALFQTFTVDFRFTFDVDGQIAGLYFGASRPADGFPIPDYADDDTFTESNVVIGADGDWPLPGTLTLPVGQGPFPVLVLVHGSGPADRDETIGLVKPFRDLAWGLATQGIAVLRYDKRTLTHSSRVIEASASFTLAGETLDDALAAIALLGQVGRIDPTRIFILGHSLGGYAIPLISAQVISDQTGNVAQNVAQNVAGYVLLAAAARPIPDLLVEQLEYIAALDDEVTGDEFETLENARVTAAEIASLHLGSDSGALLLGASPAYWLYLVGYQPAQASRAIEAPMLILQGGADYQVTVADYNLWRSALADRSDVQFKLYPGLNHLFVEIDGISTSDDALTPGNVSQQVIDDIAAWVIDN